MKCNRVKQKEKVNLNMTQKIVEKINGDHTVKVYLAKRLANRKQRGIFETQRIYFD